MTQTVKVKLTSSVKRQPDPDVLPTQLLSHSPDVVLGSPENGAALAIAVTPTPTTLFGPRGGVMHPDGSLWIADTGHHRLMGWKKLPEADDTPADIVIGQPDFYSEGRNAKGEVGAATLNVPTGICAAGNGLIAADPWNHRVLIWNETPTESGRPADIVLGQSDMSSSEGNRGLDHPADDTLFWSYGVHWDGDRLWVCDTGNRRVLMWDGLPSRSGQKADLVLGQPTFDRRDENGGGEPDAASMRWPHDIVVADGKLFVTDAGNNRVMCWNEIPTKNYAKCDVVLGQSDVASVDHNQGNYFPIAAGTNMPYGITACDGWLIAADTASSRLIGWRTGRLETGLAAEGLAGQFSFMDKGDNRWQPPVRDSFCWPYGVHSLNGIVLVCDSGNNRVSLYRLSAEAAQGEAA